ncbi:MAG: caspase family protein [Myxococcota bacterium]
MTHRALIIGCRNDLAAVPHDVERVRAWLATVGFAQDTTVLLQDATRDAILAALGSLVDRTEPGDAVVIYYSGHGGRIYLPDTEPWALGRLVAPRFDQFLVPIDHDQGDLFRGIYRIELTLWIARLTAKTDNVTVILDCCFSSGMVRSLGPEPWEHGALLSSRGSDCRPKRRVETWSRRVSASMQRLVEWLRAEGYDVDRQHELRNPDVVLVAASEPDEESYVYRGKDGRPASVFTDALLEIVEREGIEGMTWDALIRTVVAAIPPRYGFQRPQVSGPRHRLVFQVEERPRPGALTLRRRGPAFWLDGGLGVGVRGGDRYRILGLVPDDQEHEATILRVIRVREHESELRLEQGRTEGLRSGLLAVPIAGGPAHVRCRLGGSPWAAELSERLQAVPGLAVLDAGERGVVDFEIATEGRGLTLVDPAQGVALREAWVLEADGPPPWAEIADAVQRVARGSALRALAIEGGGEHRLDPSSYEIEWGVVREGERRPLERRGVHLQAGDRVYLRLTSKVGTIHASVLLVGVDRSVTLWSAHDPEGLELAEGATTIVGSPALAALRGTALDWPGDVVADGPRQASFAVIMSNRRVPVTAWATGESERSSERVRGAYQAAMASRVARLSIEHIPFHLHPPARTVSSTGASGDVGALDDARTTAVIGAPSLRHAPSVTRSRRGPGPYRRVERVRSATLEPSTRPCGVGSDTIKRALIVGIDDYPDPVRPLYGSVHDAQQVHARLSKHEDGSPNFHCDTMTSDRDRVTHATLMNRIDELLAPGADRAVFYFAGHGSVSDLGGLLLTQDYTGPHSCVRMSEILRRANDSEVDDVLIVLDCCGSGAFGQHGEDEAVLAEGVSVLTASRPEQEATEGERGGLFTSLLCEALDGGAADVRGLVTVASAYAYIAESLGAWDQRPQLKVHLSHLAPLRCCAPAVPMEILRALVRWFPRPSDELALDPSYEPKAMPRHAEHEAIFAKLQTCRGAKLVEPVGTRHMYFAAMEGKSCRLTSLGRHYWHMVTENLL